MKNRVNWVRMIDLEMYYPLYDNLKWLITVLASLWFIILLEYDYKLMNWFIIGPHNTINLPRTYNGPDNKVHGANMGPTWVLSAPGGSHVGLTNLAIWGMLLSADHQCDLVQGWGQIRICICI